VTGPLLLPAPREAHLDGPAVPAADPVVRLGAPGLPAEGYALTVGPDGTVTVDAADEAGARWAAATLAQLRATHDGRLPVGAIRDWPDRPVRAAMLDISRDKVPTLPELESLVDRLAGWKVNQLQLYMEHTFAAVGHEEVWQEASALSAGELARLDAHCASRGVELVPNQNCLGHLARWLRHPRYAELAMDPAGYTLAGLRFPPATIEPAHPRSFPLVADVLGQLVAALPRARFVHVGLDEPWEMPPERIGDYLAWMRRLRDLPALEGREMLVWGDVLAGHPDRLAQVPEGVTVVEWGYDAGHPFAERLARLADAGVPAWVAPGTSSWWSILGRVPNMCANVAEATAAAAGAGAAGLLQTDWGDNGHLQPPPVSEPGWAVAAALGWCAATNAEVCDRLPALLDAHAFADAAGVLGTTVVELGSLYRLLTPQLPNLATMVLHLYFPQLPVGRGLLDGATAGQYATVADRLDDLDAGLARARPARGDGPLVLDELRHAIGIVRLCCDDAHARLEGDGTLASVPEATRGALAERTAALADEHDRLWAARNRPGGMADSRAWLDHLARCQRLGEAPLDWSGPHRWPPGAGPGAH
jgi:hypothetical protein